jgi:hypothetical protein
MRGGKEGCEFALDPRRVLVASLASSARDYRLYTLEIITYKRVQY